MPTQQWSRESRPAPGDRDHSLSHRSRSPIGHGRSPPQRRSRSRSRSPPRRADDLRSLTSWEAQQQQRRRAPFEGGRARTGAGPRCRFFGTQAGCRKGRDCNFSHVTSGLQPQQPQRQEPTEPPVDVQTFKKEVVELLARSGEIPLGHLINRHQKAYGHTTPFRPLHRALHRARSGKQATGYVQPLRALLLSEVFSSDVEIVPWAAGPNPGEFVVRLTTPSSQLQRVAQQLQQQQEAERLRLEAVEDEAWRALPPQPVRQLPRAPPPPQPMGQPQHRPPALPVASAAHQASSRLELRVTSRSQPRPISQP